jgi:hypothetical protein
MTNKNGDRNGASQDAPLQSWVQATKQIAAGGKHSGMRNFNQVSDADSIR